MNDVIVGVDRSDTARRAAQAAAELATAYHTNLHVVMCVERSRLGDITVGSDRFHADWLSEAERYLEDLVRSLHTGPTSYTVAAGDPADTLCEEAERLEARVIVVGNRRAQGASRVLGSVAQDVIRHAPCDVLVANTHE